MPTPLVDKQGKTVQIPDDQVQAAIASGQYGAMPGQTFKVRNAAGTIGTLDGQAAVDAFAQGHVHAVSDEEFAKAEAQNKFGGVGGTAATIGVNALDALALGAGKGLAVGAAGLVSPEAQEATRSTLRGLDEANPNAALVGQGIGIAAPLALGDVGGLIGGGAKAAGAGVRAVDALGGLAERGAQALVGTGAEGLLARAGQRAVALGTRGAVEGAVYGAGGAISRNALDEGDHELTAEKLLAGAKEGALTGGALGAALGGGGTLVSGALGKLADAVLPKIQEKVEQFANERAFKAAGGSKSWLTKAMDRAGGSEEISRDLLERGHINPGATVEKIAESTADDVKKLGQKVGGMLEEMDAQGARVDAGKVIKRTVDEVVQPLQKLPGYENVTNAVTNYIDSFAEKTKLGEIPLSEAHQFRKGLDDLIYRGSNPFANPSPAVKELRAVRGILEDEIIDSGQKVADGLGKDFAKEYQETKRLYSSMKFANEMAEDAVARKEGNRFFSPTDYLAGGFGSNIAAAGAEHGVGALSMLHPGAAAAGVLTAAVHKVARERGSAILASGAYNLAKMGTDAAVGEAMQKVAARVDNQINAAVEAAIGVKTKHAVAEMPIANPQTPFHRAVADVSEYATSPEMAVSKGAKAIGALGEHAPATAAAVLQLQQKRNQYLQTQIPAAQGQTAALQPQFTPPRVPKAAQDKFLRAKELTEKPLVALDLLKKKQLTRPDVKTLEQTSPRLLQQMRQDTMDSIQHAKGKIHYQTRIQAGTLLGIPTTPSLQPAYINTMQQMHNDARQQKQAGGGGGGPRGPRRPLQGTGKHFATETQRIEGE